MIDPKITQEMILQYCQKHSEQNSPLLMDIEKHTLEHEDVPQMLCGELVGNFLQSSIKMIKAKKIIEVGMFTGFSSLKMAEVLPDGGKIHTCELMDKHIKTAQSFFNNSPHGNKITIHAGEALESLEQMPRGKFDMAFIDADKINYLEYYKRCLALIRCGGIIILDNMLWSGNVINPPDVDSKALRETGDFIQKDQRVFNMLLPIRDGLMVCIKNEK
tara:strand:+ start:112 stop:762 length:651 start_codon:yes stop_codon:yes gene_type:complete